MRNFFIIWRKELAGSFLSPIGYVITVVFLAMSGFVFLQMTEGHVGSHDPLALLMFKVIIFFWLPMLVTVITMRLFAEERRSGTIETLMTAPVTERAIVLGKFAGAFTFLLIVTTPALSSIFILAFLSPGIDMTTIDLGAIYGGCVILLLLSLLCISIGLFMSIMTKNQIVAAICCFCGVLLPLMAQNIASLLPYDAGAIGSYVSARTHVLDFARGTLDTRSIILYLSCTVLMLFVSIRILESRRWR